MSLFAKLQQRAASDQPVKVGVIGAGKFGTMFLSQAIRLPGIHVVGVADLMPETAKSNLANAGWQEAQYSALSLEQAASDGNTHIMQDAFALAQSADIEIIVEATGNPVVAVDHILAAFEAGKHVVSATVEADALCGAALAKRAREAGVIYSMAYGDQPAMICDLVDWARTCGFEVAAAGRGHKWKPEYRLSTPDTVWDHWGLTREQAERGRLNPKMFNSFLDGTKPAIESSAVANACGLHVPTNGLIYPSGSIDNIPSLMRPEKEGGVLEKSGMVEVISSVADDGSLYDYDIRMGVFVCVEAVTDYQRHCFEEYKVTTDPSGKYMCLYKRWHLIGLELGMSVAQVALRGESTGTCAEFRGDVVAVAKRDLAVGDRLDGEGGYTVAGQLRPADISVKNNMLPLGLASDIKVVRPVAVDQVLTYADVEVDTSLTAYRLRKDVEQLV